MPMECRRHNLYASFLISCLYDKQCDQQGCGQELTVNFFLVVEVLTVEQDPQVIVKRAPGEVLEDRAGLADGPGPRATCSAELCTWLEAVPGSLVPRW